MCPRVGMAYSKTHLSARAKKVLKSSSPSSRKLTGIRHVPKFHGFQTRIEHPARKPTLQYSVRNNNISCHSREGGEKPSRQCRRRCRSKQLRSNECRCIRRPNSTKRIRCGTRQSHSRVCE